MIGQTFMPAVNCCRLIESFVSHGYLLLSILQENTIPPIFSVQFSVANPISIKGSMGLADNAYRAFRLREYIATQQTDYCIPQKSNELEPLFRDWWRYKERHLVECIFLKLKEFRRAATLCDKHACRYLGFVHLACIRILLA